MRGINLSELAVKHRAVTLFLIIAILAAGIFSFGKLGRAEDPSFTVKVMTITAAQAYGPPPRPGLGCCR